MLVKFSVANFLSFKERMTLNLAATAITEFQESNVFPTTITDLRLLKSLVIYGSNSSGKSNMFKALNFMRWFMLNSSKDLQANESIDVTNFVLNTKSVIEPSYFEIEVIVESVKYRYGFKVDRSIVHEEWLYYVKKIKEYPLFIRSRQDINIKEKFNFGHQLKDLTRDNALFLSVAAQFNSKISIEIIRKVGAFKFVSGVRDESHIDQTVKMLEDSNYTRIMKDFLLSANLGFNDVKTERIKFTEEMLVKAGFPSEIKNLILKENKENVSVNTGHQVYDENNNPVQTVFLDLLRNESLGTQKYFSLAGPIVNCLITGGLLIVDEFSSRMNPVLCESIIKLFNSKENNPNNAQFVFVTHNTLFVSRENVFRRDQMILFKKDKYGATEVKSLFDLRVRKDASFEKEYLAEMFETLPKINISYQLSLWN